MAKQVVIALTGGPCAGKTTILSAISQKVANAGWDVYIVREVATRLIEQGMRLKEAIAVKNVRLILEYEGRIIQCSLEDLRTMKWCAWQEGRDALIICDRGIPDVRAYLSPGDEGSDQYRFLLREVGLDEASAFALYDGVIKLTTAADGAEEFYTLENNLARDESPEEARRLDRAIQKAYLGHPHLRVIDNSTDFEGKKARAMQEVFALLGIPVPYEIERKYLIDPPVFEDFPVPYRAVEIEQIYLLPSVQGESVRIRQRTIGNSSTHYLTKKRNVGPGTRIETEEIIGWKQYIELCSLRDPERGIIRKRRYCFLWENQYFELDVFQSPDNVCLLEVELVDISAPVSLPPFVAVKREVTDNDAFSNHNMALVVQ